ncbi:MAG TPA: aldolase [Parvularcula sp.]|nr:aldolase [Parvularcula sp.]
MGQGDVTRTSSFRSRLLAREPLIGAWVKTPSPIVADVLGLTGLDCVCIDAEHAPFDRLSIDACLSSLRASDMPALVRPPSSAPEHILNALDCGAVGIVAPHIRSREEAEGLSAACRYGAGGRGFAGSSRAAGYTTRPMSEHLKRSNAETAVIAQIEDLEALRDIDAIAGVEGVDCLFVGRIDLTVALGAASPTDDVVIDAVQLICTAGISHQRPVGMFVGDLNEIPRWRKAGASLFILKSDHAFILEGARALRTDFERLAASGAE